MKEKRNSWFGGLLLIVIGVIALLAQFVNISVGEYFGLLILPALSVIFLAWGIVTRQAGPIIPGGILGGLGLGTLLIAGPWNLVQGDSEGGLFMLAFAFGWALITILTAVFTEETHWWALIVGGIMGLIGFGVLFGGVFLDILSLLGKAWPLLLVALGLYILFQGSRNKPAKS